MENINSAPETMETKKSDFFKSPFMQSVGVGLLAAVCLLLVSYFLPVVIRNIEAGGFYGSDWLDMVPAAFSIVTILMSTLVIFFPVVWFWNKFNWKFAMLVLSFEIVWLIVIALLIVLCFRNSAIPPVTRPIMY